MMRCLIIFAKEPQEGRVKTRLLSCLSKDQCLKLYKAFLKDTIALAKTIPHLHKILAYDSEDKNPQYLRKISPHFRFYRQKGKNLGQRMHNAFKFARSRKASKIVIIGSDSPTLPADFIKQAFERLDENDVVVGPSYDGGYYLIALKRPFFGLFKGIKWSSNKVLKDTIKNAKETKKKIVLLEKWYDVDEPKSLIHLRRDLKKQKDKRPAKHTKEFLKI